MKMRKIIIMLLFFSIGMSLNGCSYKKEVKDTYTIREISMSNIDERICWENLKDKAVEVLIGQGESVNEVSQQNINIKKNKGDSVTEFTIESSSHTSYNFSVIENDEGECQILLDSPIEFSVKTRIPECDCNTLIDVISVNGVNGVTAEDKINFIDLIPNIDLSGLIFGLIVPGMMH